MINSVSGVSFRSNEAHNIISDPGKFTTQTPAAEADKFEGSEKPKKKGAKTALAVTGVIAGLAVATLVTLGILSGKGKLTKIEGAEKAMDKFKNVLADVGEWAADKGTKCWNWARGLFGGGKKDKMEELG